MDTKDATSGLKSSRNRLRKRASRTKQYHLNQGLAFAGPWFFLVKHFVALLILLALAGVLQPSLIMLGIFDITLCFASVILREVAGSPHLIQGLRQPCCGCCLVASGEHSRRAASFTDPATARRVIARHERLRHPWAFASAHPRAPDAADDHKPAPADRRAG